MVINEVYNSPLNDVHFHDQHHGYVVGDFMSMRYTNDGGNTWQIVPSNEMAVAGQTRLNAVFTDSENSAYAVGTNKGKRINNGLDMSSMGVSQFNGSDLH